MSNSNKCPECPFDHPDCFALLKDKCTILTDTRFNPGRDCPFYKPENEVDFKIVMKKFMEEFE